MNGQVGSVQAAELLHLALLFLLILIAWFRGRKAEKGWIAVFPFLALIFDLVPLLNLIPFVPTVMHLMAIILGVSARRTEKIKTV